MDSFENGFGGFDHFPPGMVPFAGEGGIATDNEAFVGEVVAYKATIR